MTTNKLELEILRLQRISEHQSEMLALALKEKNDALQRMRTQTNQLVGARQEIFELRLRSLREQENSKPAIPKPKFRVGQAVMILEYGVGGLSAPKIDTGKICQIKDSRWTPGLGHGWWEYDYNCASGWMPENWLRALRSEEI